MKRTLITPALDAYPPELRTLMDGAVIYDSSCSPEARMIFIDRDGGYFLKSAATDTLRKEAEMTAYFHRLELGAEVLMYTQHDSKDMLLTRRVAGEDCTHQEYLSRPERLCDLIAEQLRTLHETDTAGCPVPDRMSDYLALAKENYLTGNYDSSQFPDSFGYTSAEHAWGEVEKNGRLLKNEVLLHGDYCLPNIMLDRWRLSGFIDLGNGGIGDRHVDIFWGIWTLFFNLKTDRYTQRFIDAYGKDAIERDKLHTVAAAEVFG